MARAEVSLTPAHRLMVLYAAAALVATSTAGAMSPWAPRALLAALFDLNLALALAVFAGVWLSTPRGPDAVHSWC